MGADNKPMISLIKRVSITQVKSIQDEALLFWRSSSYFKNHPEQSYNIAKMKDLEAADANGDGMVDY